MPPAVYNQPVRGSLQLASSIVLNVTGQLLLKRAAMAGGGPNAAVYRPFLSGWFMLGLTCLGFGSVLWVTVLKKMPLTLAHPITAISFILVPFGSHLLWSEPLPAMRMIGILVIILGVILVAREG
jgi:multidrug transporter EmrE-like cation transporter